MIKIPKEAREAFLAARRAGATLEEAADFARMPTPNIYRWKTRAEEDPVKYWEEADFLADYDQAHAAGVVHHLQNIYDHGERDWRASAKWLALNGRTEKKALELTGAEGGPVRFEFDLSKKSDEELAELERLLEG